MGKLKIAIVEDELLTATDIEEKVTELGYTVVGIAQSAEAAIKLVNRTQPDVLLMDVKISGEMDGIAAADQILQNWYGPIIFLTAFSDKEIVDRAKKLIPAAYILKPFNMSQLSVSLEFAIHNFLNNQVKNGNNANSILNQALFIHINQGYQKIMKADILYIEAMGSYIQIKSKNQNHLVSTNLKSIEKQINDHTFVRIHRKYLVNIDNIDRIEGSYLFLEGLREPLIIGELFRKSILTNLKIIKSK